MKSETKNSKSYKDLIVWQKAMSLVTEVYKLTVNFPKTEIYGLTSQIRRCSVSIPSNIAEGRARKSSLEYRRFLIIAYGSGAELETQIEITKNIYSDNNFNFIVIDNLLNETMRMLNKRINTII